jgi:hypothetical protein
MKIGDEKLNGLFSGALVFFNVGWMESYRGIENDPISKGGEYVDVKKIGSERFNFLEHEGKVYGFVELGHPKSFLDNPTNNEARKMRIQRLGAKGNDASIDNVTVIWVARHNEATVIVGWYKNATVHRVMQKRPFKSDQHDNSYNVVANAGDAVLVPSKNRTFEISRGKKCTLGQCNVWYAEKVNRDFIERIKKYMDTI